MYEIVYSMLTSSNLPEVFDENADKERDFFLVLQNCLVCFSKISAFPGSRGATCQNCGYKDPCCE